MKNRRAKSIVKSKDGEGVYFFFPCLSMG